jgi:uncharacterized protein YdaU (DUF1376 family)
MSQSLSYINFHMRDYQRDTQQLPLEGHGAYFLLLQHCWTHGNIPPDDVARAAICKVTVQRWRKQLAPLVAGYFDENGENKRATVEIAKAEKGRLQKAMAGHNGGVEAAARKELRKQAVATAAVERSSSGRYSGGEAAEQRPSSGREAIKKDITNTFSDAARAREAETPTNPAAEPAAAAASGLAMAARQAVAQQANSIGSGELLQTIAAKGWIRP